MNASVDRLVYEAQSPQETAIGEPRFVSREVHAGARFGNIERTPTRRMQRSTDRILTTHTGSIPRPPELLALSSSKTGPPKDPALYAQRLRLAVAEVVRQQAKVGIDIVNDGEFGKDSWGAYILSRISGFELRTRSAARRGVARPRARDVRRVPRRGISARHPRRPDRGLHRAHRISRPRQPRSRDLEPDGRAARRCRDKRRS